MFNVYAYDRKLKDIEAQKHKEEKREILRRKSLIARERLATRYKERIDEVMLKLSAHPVENSDHLKEKSSFNHSFRDEKPEKFLGDPIFRVNNFKTERERIDDTVRKNDIIRPDNYVQPKYGLRARSPQKEVNPQFRFTAKNGMERVVDMVERRGLPDLRGVDLVQVDATAGSRRSKTTFRSTFSNTMHAKPHRIKPRRVMQGLHQKTHFKAITGVAIGANDSASASPKRGIPFYANTSRDIKQLALNDEVDDDYRGEVPALMFSSTTKQSLKPTFEPHISFYEFSQNYGDEPPAMKLMRHAKSTGHSKSSTPLRERLNRSLKRGPSELSPMINNFDYPISPSNGQTNDGMSSSIQIEDGSIQKPATDSKALAQDVLSRCKVNRQRSTRAGVLEKHSGKMCWNIGADKMGRSSFNFTYGSLSSNGNLSAYQ